MSELIVTNISKRFGEKIALDGVSLAIGKGEIHSLLGENGAGKTTLLRIINGIMMPDDGSVAFHNRPITIDRALEIGYLPEERGLYKKMTVAEQIEYFARLRGEDRTVAKQQTKDWLQRLQLWQHRNRRLEELSKGMAQKVQFIISVIHHPKLLILDEPFSGFDPVNADLIRKEIIRLRNGGTTIILSTHDMNSVDSLCDSLSLIQHGHIVLQGNKNEIKQRFKQNLFRYVLQTDNGTQTHTIERQPNQTYNQLLMSIMQKGQVQMFEEILPSINEIFIRIATQ